MRFLFIANDFPNPWQPTKGIFNLQLVRALARHHEVRVISPIPWIDEWRSRPLSGPALDSSRCVLRDGIEVYHPRYYYPPKVLHSHYGWFYWHSIRATALQLMRSYPPDAVLAYWAHPDGQAAICTAQIAKAPAAVIVGGSDVLLITRDPSRRSCVVRTLAAADAVITVSQYLKDKTVELGIPPEKVYVWRQGVDTDLFHPGDRIEARRRLGLPAQGRVLLWVGRMVSVKAVDVLIEVAAILRSRGVAFHLYLVGDGPLRPRLQSQAAALGLAQTISFAGARLPAQLPDWYRAADLTVLSSWSEGLPNVLRESLACGTPFVATHVGGISEVADDPARQLVPPGNADALADAIERHLSLPSAPPHRFHAMSWEESADSLLRILSPAMQSVPTENAVI